MSRDRSRSERRRRLAAAPPSRGRFFAGLPPMIGGKRRVAAVIFRAIEQALPRPAWTGTALVDPFAGGGALALLAKALGFEVTAGDVSARGAVVARALIENSHRELSRSDLARLVQDIEPAGFADRERFYARALATAAARAEPVRSLLQLVLIKALLGEFPGQITDVSDGARTVADGDLISPGRLATYMKAPARRAPSALWRIAQRVNASVIGGVGHAHHGDGLALLRSGDWEVAVLDPPYPGVRGYGRSYALLDRLLDDAAGGERDPPTLDQVLDAAAGVPTIALTYGGRGASLDALTAEVAHHRTVRYARPLPLRHLPALSRKERSPDDFLIIATR